MPSMPWLVASRLCFPRRVIGQTVRQPCQSLLGLAAPSAVRYSYKFATPPSPNLEKLRHVLTVKLVPIHFFLRNDITFGNYVWDQHFIGIMCSPKFEGKTHKEMRQMVEDLCAEVGLPGRVHMICQPPSRWHMMKARTKRRWDFDR
mmetsp:Transcript_69414/g.140605  ORF Transcript_69414/g.140605 Transcript_69414/m.140605 type:complete len:146 (+) Transcript_69414:1-438(+)